MNSAHWIMGFSKDTCNYCASYYNSSRGLFGAVVKEAASKAGTVVYQVKPQPWVKHPYGLFQQFQLLHF